MKGRGDTNRQGGREQLQEQASPALLDTCTLHHTEDPWQPSFKLQQYGAYSNSGTQEVLRKVQSILNKLTPQKFQTLCQQVLDLDIVTEDGLRGLTHLVVDNMITSFSPAGPNYAEVYANLCRCLIHLKAPSKDHPREMINFRQVLLRRCKAEFERISELGQKISRGQQLLEVVPEEEKPKLQLELLMAKRRALAMVSLIGELFKLKLLTANIMHSCVEKLLKACSEESLECLCLLLTTMGKELDLEQSKAKVDQYFETLHQIINQKRASTRMCFLMRDLIDLRMNDWEPRRPKNVPKTLEQIHREAERETQQLQQRLGQQPRQRRRQWERGRGWRQGVRRGRGAWVFQQLRELSMNVHLPAAADSSVDTVRSSTSLPEQTVGWQQYGRSETWDAAWDMLDTPTPDPVSTPTSDPATPQRQHTTDKQPETTSLTAQTVENRTEAAVEDRPRLPIQQIAAFLDILVKEDVQNEHIIAWIQDNIDEARRREPVFIRTLMTAVCKSAITGESPSLRCDTQAVQKRVVLLQKYLDNESTRELQALFALQALIVKLDHPPHLLRMFFDTLYDEDLISAEAFFAWESDSDPAEQAGKGIAVKSVTAFLVWLREAKDESSSDGQKEKG
ncbi:PREDICTED: eukaryotic translation initiation factor 4 gamma 1-like [Branchiostoma belcheri]|uniref:Eukaryotic translation initiation factor 4 gamma 1-like n=1 Tax=Branchiostoma belcheri TaxID=7741 RepID=A0A6P5ABU4_BRABE|nr:PREDICTED: eukaryotic translation initiation factor 4 gamma 1-like [Branchiostoma belcheri]